MKGGGWVKCVESFDDLFLKGKLYKIYSSPYYNEVVLMSEKKIRIGFWITDFSFKERFGFCYSQKRGTTWATRRQQ